MKANQKQSWEQKIAAYLGVDADYVIVHKRQIRTQNYGSRSNILDPEAITIFDEKYKEPRHLSSYMSELSFTRSRNDEVSLDIVQVYAIPDDWINSKEQDPLNFEAEIQNILRSD